MRSRTAALAMLLAALIGTSVVDASGAWAASAPSPKPTPSFSPPPGVDAATREVQQQQKALATESARLAQAALDATTSLQAYQQALRQAADAAVAARDAKAREAAAQQATTSARTTLRGYAGSLYRGGMVDPGLLLVTAAMSSQNAGQFFNGLGVAAQVGNRRGQVLGGLALAQVQEESAAVEAQQTAERSRLATTEARAANAAAKRAVAAYRQQVTNRQKKLTQSTAVLQVAKIRDRNLKAAEAIARAAGWRPTPRCKGRDISTALNGRLPLDALCPLDFTTGHRLRGDAAYAFNSLAREYAATFGTPLCVTDSYRTLDAQIAVKAEKPELAASPGRSNHGWGIAVDLCGGIESFDTPVHKWLLDNAVLFGWFHPAWAEPLGSKPEPWHWEFAG